MSNTSVPVFAVPCQRHAGATFIEHTVIPACFWQESIDVKYASPLYL